MRVVASLTTIQSRVENITETLQSIVSQSRKLDAIYLNVPYTCQLPESCNDYCHIIRGQDYGPISKIIGTLLMEKDPETIIITFDDDGVYPESLVEKLLAKHRINPDCAIGSSGLKIGRCPFYASFTFNDYSFNKRWYSFDVNVKGEPVDILFESPGVLYQRKFFPDVDKLLEYSKDNDYSDIVLSGYLSTQDIPRYVYRMPSVHGTNVKNVLSFAMLKAIYHARSQGMFQTPVAYTRSKTLTFPLIMISMAIILFGVLFSTRKGANKGANKGAGRSFKT